MRERKAAQAAALGVRVLDAGKPNRQAALCDGRLPLILPPQLPPASMPLISSSFEAMGVPVTTQAWRRHRLLAITAATLLLLATS